MANLIHIENLCKRYPNFGLENISFDVPGGSIVGFVGENGSGKTTTIKSILNLVHKDSGTITLLGQNSETAGADVRGQLGVVFDECCFHNALRANQVGSILKSCYSTWDDALYASLLEHFGLAHLTGRKDTIKTYSRGMKMKLSIAAALAHRPRLLILDEATSGLDPIVRDEILDLFLEFIQDEEHSILFSSHITTDIEKAADYLVFIHKGKIILNGAKDELLDDHALLRCTREAYATLPQENVVGMRENSFGLEVLVKGRESIRFTEDMVADKASVDDIMLFTIRGVGK